MNKYELAVVVSAKIEDEDRAATIEKVKEQWGKRKLAYEIQIMREGFYYFVRFESDAACPAEVEKRVRIMENVIRYLCVRQDA